VSALANVEKSPYADLSYTVNWSAWLQGADTLDTVTWEVPSGLTKVSDTISGGNKAVVRLTGGTAGSEYDVVCKVTTVGGLKDQRTLHFVIVAR
jgi:hypothetical protein